MGEVRIIKASAGSGKTFRLAYQYIRAVVEEPMQYRHILAVTFTNKATEEMKRRIVSELNALAEGDNSAYMEMLAVDTGLTREEISRRALKARTRILHDYSRFAVLTIDKFFQRIIRSFVKELGIDLNFNLELQTDGLVGRSAEALVERMAVDGKLRRWLSEYVEERIDDNRQWDIRQSLTTIGNELFRENFRRVAAEAPGKETLREVIREAASRHRAVTARMRTAAAEAIEIMGGAGLGVSDFAYGMTGVAGYLAKTAEGRIEDYGTRVARALASDDAWYSKSSPYKDLITGVIPPLREKLEEICRTYRDNCRFLASYTLLKDNYRSFALLGDLARTMEEICADEGIMPISETNNILRKLIAGNDTPFIFEKAGNYFDTFMIDEFQDTSAMQWENFLPLLQNAVSQSERDAVLLVGDVKQSIYRWRGGDWRILAEEVGRRFDRAQDEALKTNWRSRPEVVRFNNLLLEKITALADGLLTERLDVAGAEGFIDGELSGALSSLVSRAYGDHAQRSAGKRTGGHVTVTYYGITDEEPVPPVIRKIEELQQRGFGAGDIAVLVRYNADGVRIADMLLQHKSRNPESPYCYDVVTQEALTIGSSAAVNFVMACFRLSAGDEEIPQKVFYNNFLGRGFGEPLPPAERDFLLSLGRKPVTEAFDEAVAFYGITDPVHAAYLQALQDQILGWTDSRIGDMPMFVRWWDEAGAVQSVNVPGNGKAITIVSIHKSKGLEYKAVIIPYCNWSLTPGPRTLVWTAGDGGGFERLGTVPVPYSEKMGGSHFSAGYFSELAMSYVDNINLFYVAATRAEEELHIMIPGIPKTPGRISSLIHTSLSVAGDVVELGAAPAYEGVSEVGTAGDGTEPSGRGSGCGYGDAAGKDADLIVEDRSGISHEEGNKDGKDGREGVGDSWETDREKLTVPDGKIPPDSGGTADCQIPGETRTGGGSVTGQQSNGGTGNGAAIPGPMKGRVENTGNEITISFGQPVSRSEDTVRSRDEVVPVPFVSYPVSGRVRQKRSYGRFEEEGMAPAVTPRDYGILLHSVFESARSRDDVRAAVDELAANGSVSPQERENLCALVDRAFENPYAADWFGTRWERVLNERDILVPGAGFTRRPDRVMVDGDETVVVDFKFGGIRDNAHLKQVGRYRDLLEQIHGGTVRGYVWYVTLGEVAEV